jgi:hypothetical protein
LFEGQKQTIAPLAERSRLADGGGSGESGPQRRGRGRSPVSERARRLACVVLSFLGGSGVAPGAGGLIPAVAAGDHETLMREGVAYRRAGEDAAALKRFQQAYELSKTPRALAQIGLAEQALGRWAAADKHLRQAVEWRENEWIRKNRRPIDEALAVVAGHVGQLEVQGTPAGAEVRVDGDVVGKLPLSRPITVTAGEVAVQVRAPGHLAIVRTANVASRTLTRETFDLQALGAAAGGEQAQAGATPADEMARPPPPPRRRRPPARSKVALGDAAEAGGTSAERDRAGESGDGSSGPPSPPAAAAADGSSSRRGLVLVTAGLSAASLAFGVVEHWSWQDKVASFGMTSGCGATFPNRGGPGCGELYQDGLQARTLALVGYGLTAAFAITAAILLLTDGGGSGGGNGNGSVAAAPRVVACAPDSTLRGVACAVHF